MKKKLFASGLGLLLIASILTGCSMPNIPFFGKGDEEPNEELTPEDTRVSVVEGILANAGDTVYVDDLVTIDDAEVGNVIQKVIIQDDYTVAESYTFAESGVYTLTVMVEFIDGTVWDGTCTIDVAEVTLELPDALSDNIAKLQWTVRGITGLDTNNGVESIGFADSGVLLSYAHDNIRVNDPGILIGNLNLYDADMPTFDMGVFTDSQLNELRQAGSSPLAHDVVGLGQLYGARAMASMARDEETEQRVNMIGWMIDFYNGLTTATMVGSDKFLYSVDGSSYQVYIVEYSVSLAPYGGETYTFAGPMCVKYPDGRTLMFVDTTHYLDTGVDVDQALTKILGNASEEDSDEQGVEVPSSYEEFVQRIIMSDGGMGFVKSTAANRQSTADALSSISRYLDYMILGDVTPLRPVAEDVTIVVGEGEEEPEESGMVGEVYTPYAQKYPQIYTWPNNETKYRRWIYIIDSDTNFVSTIINPDGTSLISGWKDDENDWRLDIPSGQQTGTGSGSSGPNTGEQWTLSSAYSTYEINTAGMQGVDFKEDQSTSGRLVITYKGKNYYIETATASRIQGYIASSIYPTSAFKDGSYNVQEYSADAQTTSIGKIIPYKISYTDSNGNYQTKPYMEVYNIYNDYLVIYADDIPGDATVMRDLLWNLVQLIE